jgi:hypothetical protein
MFSLLVHQESDMIRVSSSQSSDRSSSTPLSIRSQHPLINVIRATSEYFRCCINDSLAINVIIQATEAPYILPISRRAHKASPSYRLDMYNTIRSDVANSCNRQYRLHYRVDIQYWQTARL